MKYGVCVCVCARAHAFCHVCTIGVHTYVGTACHGN